MPINTFQEKLSIFIHQQPWNAPVPFSSDGIGRGDQQYLLWSYSGIFWTIYSGQGNENKFISIYSEDRFKNIRNECRFIGVCSEDRMVEISGENRKINIYSEDRFVDV